jgi:hypothetical protein
MGHFKPHTNRFRKDWNGAIGGASTSKPKRNLTVRWFEVAESTFNTFTGLATNLARGDLSRREQWI